MLPGVEVARRRRVRAGQGRDGAYDGGVRRSETHRSRLAVAGAHHHYQKHHLRLGSPQYHLRAQDTSADSSSGLTVVSSHSSNLTESITDIHRSREEHRSGARSTSFLRRHSHTDPGDLAMEARNRLDERLQPAALPTHSIGIISSSGRKLAARGHQHQPQSSQTAHLIYLESNLWRDESSRNSRVIDWLATCVLSLKQCLNLLDFRSTNRSSTTTLSQRQGQVQVAGLTTTVIDALPREAVCAKVGDECPVCLEGLLAGETTIVLLCSHAFHPQCLTPWLSKHGQCPCCRANVTRIENMPEQKTRTLPGVETLLTCVATTERDGEKMTHC
ncbi:hypothetical protein Mapa_014376 [Marchantia paleacea]|nr:hypothetical protein Mapa_014376 [Marchantia paleacea]